MKINSVKENVIFRRAYHRGKAVNTPVMSVYLLKNRLSEKRLGITVSKKIGCSPVRNRIRRIIRAGYAAVYPLLPESTDIIIVARSAAKDLKSTDIEKVLREIFS
jgi:ribonuclease P protein component